jgi:hypothetical protein
VLGALRTGTLRWFPHAVDLEVTDLDLAATLLTGGAELVRVRETSDGIRSFVFRAEREVTAGSEAESDLGGRARRLLARLHPYARPERRR